MGSIYENRSAVEHMNDPVLPGASDAERRKAFIVRTLAAEAIARHCLNRVLLSPTLLPCFTDEKTLASLWALPDSEKKSLWGQVFNLDGLLKALENRRLIGRA
jgi:hypothetical protein